MVATRTELVRKNPRAVWQNLRVQPESIAAVAILGLLLVFALVRYDGFFNPHNITAILSSTDFISIGLMALGLTFVISAREIDLSPAAVAVLSSVTAALLSTHGTVVAVVGAVAVGTFFGAVNGVLVAYVRLPSFIVTLASAMALSGLALVVADRGRVPVDSSSSLLELGRARIGVVPWAFVALLLVTAVCWYFYSHRPFGRHVLAVGGSAEAARLMGLDVARVQCITFIITGFLSGLAGLFLTAKTATGNPVEGQGWELIAIASVILGGTRLSGGKGSVLSTLTGVALFAIVFQILNYENGQGIPINAYWQNVIRGALVLAVVLAQAVTARRAEQRLRREVAQ